MGQIETLATVATSLLQLDAMDDADIQERKKAEAKRQAILKQQKIAMAEKRANKYANGFSGNSYEKSMKNIKNSYQTQLGGMYSVGDNTMGKINLLTKTLKPLIKGGK